MLDVRLELMDLVHDEDVKLAILKTDDDTLERKAGDWYEIFNTYRNEGDISILLDGATPYLANDPVMLAFEKEMPF